MTVEIEEGRRFSQNYIQRGEPVNDSARMRSRVFATFKSLAMETVVEASSIEVALGTAVPYNSFGYSWNDFFKKCELRDFLDSITVIFEKSDHYANKGRSWLHQVSNIFEQENVQYRVDSKGGVHFAVDGEYQANQASAISSIGGSRYGAVRSHFELGQRALDQQPPQTREAIRQTFESLETLFKLMFPDMSRLGGGDAVKKLQPLIDGRFAGTELASSGRLLASFKEWVNGAHPYRHGQAVEEPDNPSLSTAVLSVSLGASYIRWLADLDATSQRNKSSEPPQPVQS